MLKFIKIKNVKNPERANSTDSGIDFFIPNDLETIQITPLENNLWLYNVKVN